MSLLTDATLVVTPNANKTGKLYSVIPSNGNGDFTVTRATTATRVNSAGLIESVGNNIPRLDYSLGSCPNLLLEPQRTNLALRSEEFDNASWTKTEASVTQNTTTSPSGIVNADSFIENTASALHQCNYQSVAVGGVYTASVYVKPNGRNWIFISIASAANYGVWFDVQNGVIGTTQSNITSASITPAGNGWFRCTMTANTSALLPRISMTISTGNNIVSYLGNGTSGLFIWGAQVEAGAYATSYIPTTTASVTRNADSISLSNVYTNGLISASGGTWFVELRNNLALTRDASANTLFLADTNLGGTNGFVLRNQGGGNARLILSKRIATVETSIFFSTTNTVKIAIKWNGTTADVFVNGVKVVTATAFTATSLEFLNALGNDVPKYINQMELWATPLTDTQLTQLTTL